MITKEDLDAAIKRMEDPEHRDHMRQFVRKEIQKQNVRKEQVARLHKWFQANQYTMNDMIALLIEKDFRKNSQRDQSPLRSALFAYSKKYGIEGSNIQWELYSNDFTAELYILGNYVFNLMIGQGSCLQIFERDFIGEEK